MSWPPVEILFQPWLPVGNVCVFANTRSYSIPSAGLFWLPTKRCQLQPGACERGGEQHGGRWHNRRAAGPASSAEPWEAGGTYVTSSGAVVCGLWSPAHGKGQKCLLGLVLCSRQARAAPGALAREHPLGLSSRKCKPAPRRHCSGRHIAGFALLPPAKCRCR